MRHDEHGPDAWLDLHVMKEKTVHGLVDDPDAGEEEQAGFDEGGDVFDLAVAVLILGVGGQVADAHGIEGDDGGDQIERGVQGLGENAEAAAENADDEFEDGDDDGNRNTVARDTVLLDAHQLGIDRRADHAMSLPWQKSDAKSRSL